MRVRVLGNFPNVVNLLYLTGGLMVDSIGTKRLLPS